jgi:hypothetical protein
MASLLVTILPEIFNAKLLIQTHKKLIRQAVAPVVHSIPLPRNHLTVSKGVTSDLRPIFQILKESVPGLRVACRMFNIDGIQPFGYE